MWSFQAFGSQVASSWALLLILGFVAFGIPRAYQIFTRAQRDRRYEASLVASSKCLAPASLHYRWPLALDLLLEAFKADRAGNILGFFLCLVEKTGDTFEQVLLGARGIDTQDPRNLEAVLKTQFNEFGLGARPKTFRPLLGHGIFTQDGEPWEASRDLLKPQFMQTRSKSFSEIQKEIEKFILSLETSSERTVDLQPLFFRLTLDTTMVVLFGRSLDSIQAQRGGDETSFAQAFDQAQHQLAKRGRLGDLYWLLDGISFRRSCKVVHDFVDKIVADALEESESQPFARDSTKRYVFLEELISRTRDPRVLRDQLINILLAGRDTTACLLSWTVTLLGKHQEIQQRLRNECLELPSFRNGDPPSAAEIKGMKYLEYVLKEVLRLYPSVPINSRSALKTTTLPSGGGPDGSSPILVRKGEAVGYCVYTMHRRKDLYGADAAAFRPSRWEPDNEDGPNLKGIGWAYLPFNGGPRICPGQDFAMLEASYTIIRLLQTFQHIVMADHSHTQERQTVTLVVANANGCKVVLTPY